MISTGLALSAGLHATFCSGVAGCTNESASYSWSCWRSEFRTPAACFGGNPEPAVKVGDMAPDFTLLDTSRKSISLHDFRGKKNVALAFYIFAFTGG